MLAWTGEVSRRRPIAIVSGYAPPTTAPIRRPKRSLSDGATGALLDLVVDARPRLATFGRVMSFLLDDPSCTQPCVPEQAWSNRRNARGAESTGLREPAATLPRLLRDKGVDIEVMFLGEQTGRDVAFRHGPADLVVANNVFAHVPDIVPSAKGCMLWLRTPAA